MKHKFTVLLCLVLIVTSSVLSIVSYNHYRSWRDTQRAKAVAAHAAEVRANTAEQVLFNHELDKLKANCAKDKAAYDALAPAQKVKTTAPDCDLQLVH